MCNIYMQIIIVYHEYERIRLKILQRDILFSVCKFNLHTHTLSSSLSFPFFFSMLSDNIRFRIFYICSDKKIHKSFMKLKTDLLIRFQCFLRRFIDVGISFSICVCDFHLARFHSAKLINYPRDCTTARNIQYNRPRHGNNPCNT